MSDRISVFFSLSLGTPTMVLPRHCSIFSRPSDSKNATPPSYSGRGYMTSSQALHTSPGASTENQHDMVATMFHVLKKSWKLDRTNVRLSQSIRNGPPAPYLPFHYRVLDSSLPQCLSKCVKSVIRIFDPRNDMTLFRSLFARHSHSLRARSCPAGGNQRHTETPCRR